MNVSYLNARCKNIVQILLQSNSYLSLQEIAQELNVSRRSIYYDLCRINEWLVSNDIPEIEVVRKKGILLDEDTKHQIEGCAEDGDHDDIYIYSPMERVEIIICGIIYSPVPVYIDKLTDYCRVSRNTIFNDLRIVVNQLQKYDLNLEYESKKGYKITGDAIKIRVVFLLNFQGLQNLFTSDALRFLDRKHIEDCEATLRQLEKELGIEYIEENRKSLAVLLPLMEQGNAQLYFANLKKPEIENKKEFLLVEKYFPQLNEKEKIYLCLHLLGGRVVNSTEEIFENTSNQMVYEITKALVSEFEKIACIEFERREELERQLFVHINASMYRYQYGIQYLDSISEDVKREYPDLFEITKLVSRYLEKQIGLPISDSEVAYLSLHFGAYLPISLEDSGSKKRVLIVCANGISTGNMLKREVRKMFPSLEVVGVQGVNDVKNAQKICDYIISTVKLKSMVPVIVVHSILTSRDKEVLMYHFSERGGQKAIRASEIFSIVKPYIAEENHSKVKTQIEEYIMQGEAEHWKKNKHMKNLLDLLTVQKIEIHRDRYKWTQALWMSGEYLIDISSIQAGYIENMIQQLREYGPYMFISDHVILAHSKPEAGVNRLDCAIHFFEEPVAFTEENHANVVILLAAENQESHLKILRDIMAVFTEEDRVQELVSKKSVKEIMEYLKEALQETNE